MPRRFLEIGCKTPLQSIAGDDIVMAMITAGTGQTGKPRGWQREELTA